MRKASIKKKIIVDTVSNSNTMKNQDQPDRFQLNLHDTVQTLGTGIVGSTSQNATFKYNASRGFNNASAVGFNPHITKESIISRAPKIF